MSGECLGCGGQCGECWCNPKDYLSNIEETVRDVVDSINSDFGQSGRDIQMEIVDHHLREAYVAGQREMLEYLNKEGKHEN